MPQPLNEQGLHLLRTVLAERILDHRQGLLFTNAGARETQPTADG